MTRTTILKKLTLELIIELKADPEKIYNTDIIYNRLDQAMTIGAEKYYVNKTSRPNATPVIQLTKDDEFVQRYPSISDAHRATSAPLKGIIESCRDPENKRKSAGYKWKYET